MRWYGGLTEIEERLSQRGFLYFIPKKTALRRVGHSDRLTLVPAVPPYVFIRAAYDELDAFQKPLRLLLYSKTLHPVDGHTTITVGEREMDDFIRVTSEESDKVVWLDNLDFACKPSQAVQITEGQFAGVKGRIKRIQGNVCVVIPIEQTAAVAIRNLPRKYLRYLSDNSE